MRGRFQKGHARIQWRDGRTRSERVGGSARDRLRISRITVAAGVGHLSLSAYLDYKAAGREVAALYPTCMQVDLEHAAPLLPPVHRAMALDRSRMLQPSQ